MRILVYFTTNIKYKQSDLPPLNNDNKNSQNIESERYTVKTIHRFIFSNENHYFPLKLCNINTRNIMVCLIC